MVLGRVGVVETPEKALQLAVVGRSENDSHLQLLRAGHGTSW